LNLQELKQILEEENDEIRAQRNKTDQELTEIKYQVELLKSKLEKKEALEKSELATKDMTEEINALKEEKESLESKLAFSAHYIQTAKKQLNSLNARVNSLSQQKKDNMKTLEELNEQLKSYSSMQYDIKLALTKKVT